MIRFILIFSIFLFRESYASSIILHTSDAVVWHPEQVITGELSGFTAEEIIVHHNQLSFSVNVTDGQNFSFELILKDSINKIWVEATSEDPAIVSNTLRYTLGFNPAPIVKPYATIDDDKATLNATVIENPYGEPLKFEWSADPQNPALSEVSNKEGAMANVEIPTTPGEYYYNLLVIADENSARFQTLVIRKGEQVQAFDIDSDYPQWMDEAIIYQVTPYNFVVNGDFAAITAKLPEIKELGINTIWIQPVYKSSYRGQGYDVVDYLSLNPAFGTASEMQQLITEAKALEMRVLFDIVLNHTSVQHPFAKDIIKHGVNSHYYDFYQHENDRKPYSSFYHKDENGFVFYFWEDLVNLNYQNEEVQRWMLEVCKYWVKEYDIDGYRFDAIWGVNARMPSFAKRLRTELKSIKPDVLLLAEDKGSVPEVYELGFDAAYDWTPDTNWVSQWSWEYDYDENLSKTFFNYPEVEERGGMMRDALFHNGGNAHKKLRYMENNDLPRFVKTHGLERTKMTAALLFALPGIPMLYNGQEVGFREHPYTTEAVFNRNWTIKADDPDKLFPYYKKLIELHKQYPALSDTAMKEISVSPDGAMVAFHRWKDDQNIIVVVNMDSAPADANVTLSDVLPKGIPDDYWLRDVLADKVFRLGTGAAEVSIPMEGYGVRWLLLEKEGEITGAIEKDNGKASLTLYPNPSNGDITINLPDLSFNNIRIYDMLRMTVFKENITFPEDEKSLNINLPSQVYFLEIRNEKEVLTTKILIQ